MSTRSIRYSEYHHSRGSEVVRHLVGESFEGVLGSDFFASYNIYQGLHQRGFVHLLRDGHDLKEQYPDDAAVQRWFTQLKALYELACSYAGPAPTLPPAKQQYELEQLLHLIQNSWRKAETRKEAFTLFPMAITVISRMPEIGIPFIDAFAWIDKFLIG